MHLHGSLLLLTWTAPAESSRCKVSFFLPDVLNNIYARMANSLQDIKKSDTNEQKHVVDQRPFTQEKKNLSAPNSFLRTLNNLNFGLWLVNGTWVCSTANLEDIKEAEKTIAPSGAWWEMPAHDDKVLPASDETFVS